MADGPNPPPPRAPAPGAPSSAVRDRAIAVLGEAFAHDALDVEEFERRVTVAQTSPSLAEVEALTADLPAEARAAPAVPERALVPTSQVRPAGQIVSVMGEARRTGSWTVPRKLTVVSVMGGAKLDFRNARLPTGVIDLRVTSVMGGVEIIVPPHLAVEADGVAIMGGFDHVERAPDVPDPAAPLLRIRGVVVMGGVEVEMRLPGETGRQARKRRRRERKREDD
jgi:hypothetical protein